MIKDKDPDGYMDDEDIQELLDFYDMKKEFFSKMKILTKPNHKHTLWNNIKDIFFTRAQKIDPSVKKFCEEKLDKIFEYAYERNLKPKEMFWGVFGFCMLMILYKSEGTDNLKLPQEMIDFAVEQFEGRYITLKKINGLYTVVFDD